MLRNFQIAFKMALPGFLLGAPFLCLGQDKPAPLRAFPAREILEAVQNNEILERKAARMNFLGALADGISWEPWAEPEMSRSWIYLEVPPKVLEGIQANIDQNGNKLFP